MIGGTKLVLVRMINLFLSFRTGVFGALVKSGAEQGTMLLYHPRRFPDLNQKYDLDFKDSCCGVADLCSLYKERRPSDDCSTYNQPAWCKSCLFMRSVNYFDSSSVAWGWGDPHITTLDGGTYTFNGWGEYVLLQVMPPNNGNNFTIQGRMVPWNMTSATKYSSFAFGGFNQPTVEVNNRSTITCYMQGY